jgi:hypothetical protein
MRFLDQLSLRGIPIGEMHVLKDSRGPAAFPTTTFGAGLGCGFGGLADIYQLFEHGFQAVLGYQSV